jgi:membrane protein
VLVSVFGLVLQNDDVRERVVDRVIEALPVDASGVEDVESAIETIATPTSAFGLISLFVFLWAATGMMSAFRRGLAAAMGVTRRRPAARGKLVDFALVAGAAVLVLLSVGIGLVAELANELVVQLSAWLDVDVGAEGKAIALSLQVLLWIVTSLLLYRFVATAGLRLQDALAGAVVTAIILLALSLGTDLVYAKTTDWSLIYGSLTSLLVFLYSVYLYAGALLLGAAVAAEWSLPRLSHDEPLRVRVRRSFSGLFVREQR